LETWGDVSIFGTITYNAVGESELDFFWLRMVIMVGSCECDNETLISTAKPFSFLELNYLASSNHSLEFLTKTKIMGRIYDP
jgi:hypothetical protein